jgi:hypothetical protein
LTLSGEPRINTAPAHRRHMPVKAVEKVRVAVKVCR